MVNIACRYYLKLDDDIVWVADGAIEAMLEEKLRGRFLYVSANVINHSSFALVCSQNLDTGQTYVNSPNT